MEFFAPGVSWIFVVLLFFFCVSIYGNTNDNSANLFSVQYMRGIMLCILHKPYRFFILESIMISIYVFSPNGKYEVERS